MVSAGTRRVDADGGVGVPGRAATVGSGALGDPEPLAEAAEWASKCFGPDCRSRAPGWEHRPLDPGPAAALEVFLPESWRREGRRRNASNIAVTVPWVLAI